MTEAQRAGVLVVSLWVEGSGKTLRARVTETSDINSAGEVTSVVGSLEELLTAVDRWARTFIDPPVDDTGSSGIGGVSGGARPGSGAPGISPRDGEDLFGRRVVPG